MIFYENTVILKMVLIIFFDEILTTFERIKIDFFKGYN